MAAKQILVKVPRTTNGINPLIVGGVPAFKEVVLPVAAKAPLEKINEKLPEHLKKVITDYSPAPSVEPAKQTVKP